MVKSYSVRKYQETDYKDWNDFIGKAKNATFLFHRNFMEYHSARFQDYSLLIFEKEKLVSVLPASSVDNTIYSHQGLTYGGLVFDERIKLASVISVFRSVLIFLDANKIKKLHIKIMPSIYNSRPADELNYALFLAGAKLERRDSLSVIDLTKKIFITPGRKEGIVKGKKNELIIKEVNDFESFWNKILIPNLNKKHQAKPVHSLEEITNLKLLFPEKIRQFNVYENEIIIAGTTVFESATVAHCQYISGNDNKNQSGSLDFLQHYLFTEVFKKKHYFDFGISNEEQGRKLNGGLVFWKESFGASTIVQDFYEVETLNYCKLDNFVL